MGAVVPFLGEPRCSDYAACHAVVGEFTTGADHTGGTYMPGAGGFSVVAAGTTLAS